MATTIPAGSRLLAEDLLAVTALVDANPVEVVKYKPSDTPRASNATYSADPHLVFTSVPANSVWALDLVGHYQASAAGSIKQKWVGPSGATFEAAIWGYDPSAADIFALTNTAAEITGATGTAANVAYFLGVTVFIGATAGDVAYHWAQNASNATATIIRKGTRARMTRLA